MADGGASIWLSYAAAAASATGLAVSAIQQSRNNKAQKSQAEREAAMALSIAEQEASDLAERNRRITASQVASFGANGLLVEGTPANVIIDDAVAGELDVQRVSAGGRNRASGRQFEARQFSRNASTALVAGGLSASGSTLSRVQSTRNSQRLRRAAEDID